MEDVLDLYEEPYDPARPVIGFDESPKQLIAEVREPLSAEPGRAARHDVEYQRRGGCEIMMLCEPQRGVREVIIMPKRTKLECAKTMKHWVGLYSEAEVIRVVLDNLNTHTYGALYEAFPPEEARVLARKLEFHYTPTHGSWLNVAEIELAVLANMCLSPRIPDAETLRREIEANVRERNAKTIKVNWRFTTQDARRKLVRLYPPISE